MNFLLIFLIIVGVLIILLFLFGYPRKKNIRIPSMEGLDNPEVARAFERMSSLPPFQLLYIKVISKLKKLDPKGKVVDVGCGTGNLIIKISNKIPNIELAGIDIAPEILEHAKKNTRNLSFQEKIKYKIGSVESLPFLDNSVDIIISTLSLHHWIDPKHAFKEIYRVLKDNGKFIIFDFRRNSRKFFYSFLKIVTNLIVPKALKRVNEPLGSLQASYTPDEVKEFLNNLHYKKPEFNYFLSWMFIIGKKERL